MKLAKQKFMGWHRSQWFNIFDPFPLVIDDPTVLFTNATITPFKPAFNGTKPRKNYALVQKCLRLGGAAGSLETARTNMNYTSLFEMAGSGLFNVSKNDAVAYFVRMLHETTGLDRDGFVFTTLPDLGFDSALKRAGVEPRRIVLVDAGTPHEWSFGEGDLHGCGVVARYSAMCVPAIEIGRLVHIDGVVRGDSVEPFPYTAYDIGLGLSRIEMALRGNCEQSLLLWRLIADRLRMSGKDLPPNEAHYLANLYLVAEALLAEGLLPGSKKHASVLRKVMRMFIEEIWLQSGCLISISDVLSRLVMKPSQREIVEGVFAGEEASLRGILANAARKQKTYPTMSQGDLRATFGIRHNLLELSKQP